MTANPGSNSSWLVTDINFHSFLGTEAGFVQSDKEGQEIALTKSGIDLVYFIPFFVMVIVTEKLPTDPNTTLGFRIFRSSTHNGIGEIFQVQLAPSWSMIEWSSKRTVSKIHLYFCCSTQGCMIGSYRVSFNLCSQTPEVPATLIFESL